ncbi:carbon-phosphorus lyase [Bacillus sp. FJAT-49711]|uniref:MBL fold metallo-hydrolase n=1 Tax=Bacillus sp. FJAT-49711 TaxID=2833585 RepID=UPI001BC9BF1A|nr:MBL fold metallo-hydrolase [Bacillus sp. FJAT-49711]MBS4219015.1 carbon-phosphorus lyase [Bacillus sp. FJAT-49711]
MIIKLLGTAAAEGYPAIFCNCDACKLATELGGKDIRTRTSAIIDQELKIDFPPDTLHHVLTNKLNLGNIEHLLFSHTHHDHFHPDDLTMRAPVYAHNISYPLNIYGNDVVIAKCVNAIQYSKESFKYHQIKPFVSFQISEYQVTPLLADHDQYETCFIFYIEKDNKKVLYGHDTGWFPQQTWDWLENKKLDLVILDCTHGLIPERRNHLNIEGVKEIKNIFSQKNITNKTANFIATHFSHNIKLTHSDLTNLLEPFGIMVAFDGMEIEI